MVNGSKAITPSRQYEYFIDFLCELDEKSLLFNLIYVSPKYFNDLKEQLQIIGDNHPYEFLILYCSKSYGLKAIAFQYNIAYIIHCWNFIGDDKKCSVAKIM